MLCVSIYVKAWEKGEIDEKVLKLLEEKLLESPVFALASHKMC
jgi:hypothetical protein